MITDRLDSNDAPLYEKIVRILLKTSSAIAPAFAYDLNSCDVIVAVI